VRRYASTVLGVIILISSPSICPLYACCVVNQRTHCQYFYTAWKGSHSSLLTPTVVSRWRYPPEICAQSDPLLEYCWVRQISAYNVLTVRASENSSVITNRKSTMHFLRSCRWSAYVTPNSPKGWLQLWIEVTSASHSLCHSWSTCYQTICW